MVKKEAPMKTRIYLGVLSIVFFLSTAATAQDIAVEWEKTFTPDPNKNSEGYSVQVTEDGGYIIAGLALGTVLGLFPHPSDVYLVKTNAEGVETWSGTYGGNGDDVGAFVQQTSDGGYAVVGHTNSSGAGASDVYLIKTDAAGNLSWEKTFGGSDEDYGNALQQTDDGGFLIAGSRHRASDNDRDIYLIKTDATGNLNWEKTFDLSPRDYAYSLTTAPDGGFVITGEITPLGKWDSDLFLVKTDSAGNELWRHVYGEDGDDRGLSVETTDDGGYIVAGVRFSHYAYLMKADAAGVMIWERTFDISNSSQAKSVKPTLDGGYIIAGSAGGDAFLLKTNADGYERWRKIIGESDYAWQAEAGYSVVQTEDQGYILAGSKATDWTVYSSIGQIPILSVFLAKTTADTSEPVYESSGGSSAFCFIGTVVMPFHGTK
jgi:hypothetical protein